MTKGGFLLRLRLAVSFLTIVPVSIEDASESAVAASMAWFPLVGAMMGAAFALEDYALGFLFHHAIRSALIVLSMAVLSGAIHLDGLTDTADALSAGRDRTRALEILRDSRIGVFGAIALFFGLALKIFGLASLDGDPRLVTLILALMLARWALVAVSYKIDYLRTEGAGSSMLGRLDNRNLMIASIFTILPLIFIHWRRLVIAYALTVIVTFAMRSFYRRWLGGITGDLIGACGEIVEVLVMLTMAAR
ncbi:MAG TPA: adenosylcobinamide-GDP ribazoletransferase [Candidatus Binataceae bacterium]|nr:adenosylcobinamide-GDP ribazoletransferase [Candidatus Binataceae bacterium]